MPDNLEAIKTLYAAFASGDMAAAASVMAPDMAWNEAENYILADRNPYVGAEAVFAGVFGRTAELFDHFAVEVGTFVCHGDTVAMQGRYSAVSNATGQRVNPQIVHWWTVKDGLITGFQQHVDTLAMARALGEAG
ncbi:nuclear transport factor 2 family protein [Erythrobacter sp. NFXS35]|uniref:nuclear transport factor 2 family protein n=1 Tax=Erythrobacter sp. NFXS35 TaxID=2818436 RepID=UPI0032E0126D